MTQNPTLRFRINYDGDRLSFQSPHKANYRPVVVTQKERDLFVSWSDRYQAQRKRSDRSDGLLKLGREIYAWLKQIDGAWFTDAIESGASPLLVEFGAPARTTAKVSEAAAFLNVPWELLANENGFLAAHGSIKFCPVRRLGESGEAQLPSAYQLSLLFMAAEPHGVPALDYQGEENAILRAVRDVGLELAVEESGALPLLAAAVRENSPDVLHISCHGQNEPQPVLCLESDEGDMDPITPQKLCAELGERRPALLFLSACLTAQANRLLTSYTIDLIQSGFPAVLGWGDSVKNAEATQFAARLYHYLAAHNSVEYALAQARWDMLNPEGSREPASDWHMARLFMGTSGGGVLAAGRSARHKRAADAGYKEFLGQRKEVAVASHFEFVGRRREIQRILREFRVHAHAGALIHGVGRQGKSSLAARAAHRRPDLKTVVVYGHYEENDILAAMLNDAGSSEVRSIIDTYRQRAQESHAGFVDVLTELLEGPFCDVEVDDKGRFKKQPILLIVDDFERALDEPAAGSTELHRVSAKYSNAIAAVIKAFRDAASDSRLLFTCRHVFTLRQGDANLADYLLAIPLPPLSDTERQRQYANNLQSVAGDWLSERDIRDRCIAVARGNPGLQRLVFGLCTVSRDKSLVVLDEMEDSIRSSQAPASEQELIDFFNNLAIQHLIDLLRPAERDALRASQLFQLPVPIAVCPHLLSGLIDDSDVCLRRLTAFGLWELFDDAVHPKTKAFGLNRLGERHLADLTEEETAALARKSIEPLYDAWAGDAGAQKRSAPVNFELVRLGLLAGCARTVRYTARSAVHWLDDVLQLRLAAAVAIKSISLIEQQYNDAELWLYLRASEVCQRVGDIAHASSYIQKALVLVEEKNGDEVEPRDRSAIYLQHARLLKDLGEPLKAMDYLQKGHEILEKLKDRRSAAVTLGDIARIKVSRGEVDDALKLHQQRLAVFEELGDRRSAAVTLGDIARIKVSRGEVDDALKLHQQELKVYEELGDRRSAAVTLGDIARIKVSRGEVDDALKLHQQRLAVFEELGDRRSAAVTLGDIARIKVSRGEVDDALKLHQQELKVYEELGDRRSKAVTLWDIAKIEIKRASYQSAFEKLAESYNIIQHLGYLDGICYVGLDLGQLLCAFGNKEEGLAILQRSKQGFEQLGQAPNAAYVQRLIEQWRE